MVAIAGNSSRQIGQNVPMLEITSFGDGQQASRGRSPAALQLAPSTVNARLMAITKAK